MFNIMKQYQLLKAKLGLENVSLFPAVNVIIPIMRFVRQPTTIEEGPLLRGRDILQGKQL